MTRDLIDDLHALGELNEAWGSSQLPEDRPPLYVVATDGPRPPSRRLMPAAIAALVLVAVVAMSVIADDPDPATEIDPAQSAPLAKISPDGPAWPAEHADSLSGLMSDGRPWSVEVDAGTWETCFQLPSTYGCGLVGGFPVHISDSSGGEELVYGAVAPALTEGGVARGDPADRVEIQLTDGSWIEADVVSDRLWVAIVPPGTSLRQAVTYHWGDTSLWAGNEPDDLGGEVGAVTEAEQRRQDEERLRRAVEAERHAELQRQRRARSVGE